jgi:hypothetical protein
MKKHALIFIPLVLMIFSCKKKEVVLKEETLTSTPMKDGLPADLKNLNGYMFAGYYKGTSQTSYDFMTYSSFVEPGKNLVAGYNHYENYFDWSLTNRLGNIDIGNVVCDVKLNKITNPPNLIYSLGRSVPQFNDSARWTAEGNKSFKPFDITIRKFPYYFFQKNNDTLPTVIKSKPYVLETDSLAKNFDSLIVYLYDWSTGNAFIRKAAGGGTKTITFSKEEFVNFSQGNTWAVFKFYAFRYSYCTIEGRLYLFESGNKCEKWIMTKN